MLRLLINLCLLINNASYKFTGAFLENHYRKEHWKKFVLGVHFYTMYAEFGSCFQFRKYKVGVSVLLRSYSDPVRCFLQHIQGQHLKFAGTASFHILHK
jgi:hypothetical protein